MVIRGKKKKSLRTRLVLGDFIIPALPNPVLVTLGQGNGRYDAYYILKAKSQESHSSQTRSRCFSYLFFKKIQNGSKKSKIQVPGKGHKVVIKVSHRKITKPYYFVLRFVLNINT